MVVQILRVSDCDITIRIVFLLYMYLSYINREGWRLTNKLKAKVRRAELSHL